LPSLHPHRISVGVSLTLRILAAALVAQLSLMVPSMGGAAHGHGPDPDTLICSTHADSPEARAALAELSEAVGLGGAREPHDPARHDHGDHCPACALAKAMALPEASSIPAFAAMRQLRSAPRPDRASPRQTAGPPVGLRAPPLTV
jgi:hypothetical protein